MIKNSIDINKILYDYQRDDSSVMVNKPLMMNGSEMGTGKTEVAIKTLLDSKAKQSLIVVPSGMMLEWRDRLRKYGEEDVALPKNGQGYRLSTEEFKHKYLIVNYEMLRVPPVRRGRRKKNAVNPKNYINVLEIPEWDAIVFDEAHRLKNRDAQQTKGAVQLIDAKPRDRVHMISGTMFLNYPNELWSMLNMLYPDEYSNYEDFVYEYCVTIQSHWGPRIVGAKKKNLPELRERLDKLMIRREKQDVLKDLPPKTYREVPLAMHAKQLKLYKDLERDLWAYLETGESITAPNGLALTMKLRQVSLDPKLLGVDIPSPKTTLVKEMIEDIVSTGKKVVVFSWFASYLESLSQELKNVKWELISGQAGSELQRREARLRFQDGDSQVMLGSISTMIGIDLTSADICIFTDRFWVPNTNFQAEDRLHRVGQKGNVLVMDLVMEDSIDQDMRTVLMRKSAAFNETIAIQRTVELMKERRG